MSSQDDTFSIPYSNRKQIKRKEGINMARGRKPKTATTRRYKNANGQGTVYKLPGNRRKPWTAKITDKWELVEGKDGKPHKRQKFRYLGYWEEEEDAKLALCNYLKNPYEEDISKVTFTQIYDIFYKRKELVVSDSSKKRYRSCMKHLKPFYEIPIVNIKIVHLQNHFDYMKKKEIGYPTLKATKDLCSMMFEIAIQNDIVDKNYASYIDLGIKEESKPKSIFTDKEIELLFKNKDRYGVDMILILLYSGMRIQELLDVKTTDVDIINWTMRGGNKTKAGRNRLIPIHTKIKPIIKEKYDHAIKCDNEYLITNKQNAQMEYHNYLNRIFRPIMNELGMKHTIHETRHTFITKMDNADANKTSLKRIVGHSRGKDVTSDVYTHKDVEQLRKAIELIE